MGTIYVVTSLITAQASHLTGVGEAAHESKSTQGPQRHNVVVTTPTLYQVILYKIN